MYMTTAAMKMTIARSGVWSVGRVRCQCQTRREGIRAGGEHGMGRGTGRTQS
jgi:hypothetical protein